MRSAENTDNKPRNPDLDFTNKQGKSTLEVHFYKHGKSFGFATADEYLKSARWFLEKPATATIQHFISAAGTYFRYDTATNEFAIINEFGGISTYFKPNTKKYYWLEQIKLYKPKQAGGKK
ncbi:MAG: hypothetical protein FWG68_02850 [Defluviitaleaceae bacterium]|nr:hypothetical protein [Defluviitaleaceae bacterium]